MFGTMCFALRVQTSEMFQSLITISNDCFFSSCFSMLTIFPIGFTSGLAKLLQSIRQQVAKVVETLHPLGALLIYLLSLALQPPSPPLSVLLARQKNWCKLKQSTLNGGEGKGSGKGLNSRYSLNSRYG